MKVKALTEQDKEEFEPGKITNLTDTLASVFLYFKAKSNTPMNVVTIFYKSKSYLFPILVLQACILTISLLYSNIVMVIT